MDARSSWRPRRTPHHPGRVIAGHPTGPKNRAHARQTHRRHGPPRVGHAPHHGVRLRPVGEAAGARHEQLGRHEQRAARGRGHPPGRGPVHHRPALPERRGGRRSSSRCFPRGWPARQARRGGAQAGRAAQRGPRARHGRRAAGLGDGQPNGAPDAASHDREQRRRGRGVARAEGACSSRWRRRPAFPPARWTSYRRRCRRSRSPARARSRRPATLLDAFKTLHLGAAVPVDRGVRRRDRAVAGPAPDRRHGRRLPDLRRASRCSRSAGSAGSFVVDCARGRAERPRRRRRRLGHRDVAARGRRRGRHAVRAVPRPRRLAAGRGPARDRDPAQRRRTRSGVHPGVVRAVARRRDPAARDLGARCRGRRRCGASRSSPSSPSSGSSGSGGRRSSSSPTSRRRECQDEFDAEA